jgi:ParB family chromosome partitioning protein
MKTITWHTETRKLSDLIPADYNPRKISEQQAEKLKKSLDTFGYVETVDINLDNTVIGGHQRLKALADLGYDEIDVRVPDRQLTKKEEQTLNVSLNKITGEFDNEKLVMIEPNVLEDAGFEPDELNEIFPVEETAIVEDELPELEEIEPKAKLGDLYQLGRHRLLCGDCTVKENVELLMDGKKADMVLTDPPYNLAGETKIFGASDKRACYKKLQESSWDKNFDPQKMLDIIKIFVAENSSIYIFTSHFLFGEIFSYCKDNFTFSDWCCWVKPNPMPSLAKRHWTWNTELIVYATNGKHTFNFPENGHALQGWIMNRPSHETIHPTEKPNNVCAHAILHSSLKNNIVLDLFLGSGSTLMACEQTDRICYGMEIDPMYCDIIIARWEKFTNEKASKLN